MLIPKMPMRQYAWSSSREHSRLDAHDIRAATDTADGSMFDTSSMPVISERTTLSVFFDPMIFQLLSTKEKLARRKEFLKCPSPREPFAAPKRLYLRGLVQISRDVAEVCVTLFGVAVPCIHGIDGLTQFRTTRLVNTARISPRIVPIPFPRKSAKTCDLVPTSQIKILSVAGILKGAFMLFPSV